MKILLGQLGSNGDCLHATIVARQIKNDFPGCRLTWAVSDKCKSMIAGNPNVDEIWEIHSSLGHHQSDGWINFEPMAKQRLEKGDFDRAFFTQICPNNFRYYDGTVQESILRAYGKPITVPVQPELFIAAGELGKVQDFVFDKEIFKFQNRILFECGSKSGQSYITPAFALEVAAMLFQLVPDTCVILSSDEPVYSGSKNIIDGSSLTIRDTATLTNYCTMLVGCASGISCVATTNAALQLPMIQAVSRSVSKFASFIHQYEYWGKPTDNIIEMMDSSPQRLAECIALACDEDFASARSVYNESIPLHFEHYFNVIRNYLLNRKMYTDAAISLSFTAARYGWLPELRRFGQVEILQSISKSINMISEQEETMIEHFYEELSPKSPAAACPEAENHPNETSTELKKIKQDVVLSLADTVNQIVSLLTSGKVDLAVSLTLNSIAAMPESIELKAIAADIYFYLKDFIEAQRYYRQITGTPAFRAKALNNLAIIEFSQGMRQAAIELIIDSLHVAEYFRSAAPDRAKSSVELSIKSSKYTKDSFLVAAIVSVYNSEKFIRGCLEDLVGQTLFAKDELEIILVDTASQQSEEAIISEFLDNYKNIKYIKTSRRLSLYAAWNIGIKNSNAKYISNTNTDDRHRPDALERMTAYLESHPGTALVYADQLITNAINDTFTTTQATRRWKWPPFSYPELEKRCIIGPQPMWRRTLHDRFGLFDESYESAGDYEFWLRIGDKVKIERIDDILGLYYENPAGLQHGHSRAADENKNILYKYGITARQIKPAVTVPAGISLEEIDRLPYRKVPTASVSESLPAQVQAIPEEAAAVSVIIPCFNHAHYLAEAVESVLVQTYKDWEIIIVDDASSDETPAVAAGVIDFNKDKRIRYFRLEKNQGQAKARNFGISNSQGKYILPLDADDIIMPAMFEKCVLLLDGNPGISIAYTDVQEFGSYHSLVPSIEYSFSRLCIFNFIVSCALFRRQLWEATGGYATELRGEYEDWDFWISAGKSGYIGKRIPEALFWYRKTGEGSYVEAAGKDNIVKARIILRHSDIYSPMQKAWAEQVVAGNPQFVNMQTPKSIMPVTPDYNIAEPKPKELSSEIKVTNKIRLLMTMYGWNESGGGTTFPKAFAKRLVKKGVDVAVFYATARHSLQPEPYFMEKQREDGVRLYGAYNRPTVFLDTENPDREIRDSQCIGLFERVIEEFKPDLVHFHNFLGLSFAMASTAKSHGYTTLYTPYNYHLIDPTLYLFRSDLSLWNGTGFFENSELPKLRPDLSEGYGRRVAAARKLLNEDIDFTLAVSRRVRDLLVQFGGNPDKIAVTHQVHETIESLLASGMDRSRQLHTPLRFGFIGGAMPHKGVHLIVQAAQMLPAGAAEFNIYGFISSDYARLLKSIDKNGRVSLKGEYKSHELPRIASELDAMILPSLWDDCAPFVITESLAMGLPVIGARIGGFSDFIKEKFNGILYKHDSPFELARILADLIANPGLLAGWQQNCSIPLTFDRHVDHLINIYKKLIDGKSLSIEEMNLFFI